MIAVDISDISWAIVLIGTFIGIFTCSGEPTKDKLNACAMMFALLFAIATINACTAACNSYFKGSKYKP